MANGHGGARPGSGRKPKRPDVVAAVPPADDPGALPVDMDPLTFLEGVMRGTIDPTGAQLKAAIAAAKYRHAAPGAGGKKGEAAKKAEEAAAGKFARRGDTELRRVA